MINHVRAVGFSEPHVGEPDKPNEDAWLADNRSAVVTIADGITRSRLPDGSYPAENAVMAPKTFVQTVTHELSSCNVRDFCAVRNAVDLANNGIREGNEKVGINQHTVDYQSLDYLATTGATLCFNLRERNAVFGYAGDVIAILIPLIGSPSLLTRDQLHTCHRFSKQYFSKVQNNERLFWQRKVARNHIEARDPDGNAVGFGAFTGEPSAMDFLEMKAFHVESGDKIILATDALRVTASIAPGCAETIDSYQTVLETVRETSFNEWPRTLVGLIRQHEIKKNTRSDDATIVAVDVW